MRRVDPHRYDAEDADHVEIVPLVIRDERLSFGESVLTPVLEPAQ